MNLSNSLNGLSSSLMALLGHFVLSIVSFFLVLIAVFLVLFCISCRCIPFLKSADDLRKLKLKFKWFSFLQWIIIDFKERTLHANDFKCVGFTLFVGRQGSGKTTAMVQRLNEIKEKYPNCIIVTNFKYVHSDFIMTDWMDLLNIRNGDNGVVFAIDEIHSEYSANDWKDIPDSLLAEISQQRKQKVCILGSSQFYSRLAKPFREQAHTVVVCSNFMKRLIVTRGYDSLEYSSCVDNPLLIGKKLRPRFKNSFVSTDSLRSCFDTYEKINRMRKKQLKAYQKSLQEQRQ